MRLEKGRAGKANMPDRNELLDLMDQVPALLCEITAAGKTVFVNNAVADILGYSPEEVVGADWWELFYPGDDAAEAMDLKRKIDLGRVVDVETIVLNRDGEKRSLSWSSVNNYGEDGEITSTIGFAFDRTAQKKTEKELDRLLKRAYADARMESLGRLTSGIAHDFNNLFAVIISYADLLSEELQYNEELWQDAQEIADAGRRAVELVEQLLLFSRRKAGESEQVDMNMLIVRLSRLLKRAVGDRMEIAIDLAQDPIRVAADPGRIELVLIEMVMRAKESMPEGGSLTIETRIADIDEEAARRLDGIEPGRYARLRIIEKEAGLGSEEILELLGRSPDRSEKDSIAEERMVFMSSSVQKLEGAMSVEPIDSTSCISVLFPLAPLIT